MNGRNDGRIGIDTHGYDEPPDEAELSLEQEAEVDEMIDQVESLLKRIEKITGCQPSINGYRNHEEQRAADRLTEQRMKREANAK